MFTIEGQFSGGKTSRVNRASLVHQNDGWISVLSIADGGTPFISNVSGDDYDISTRLGSAPRVITFSTGATFTTDDHSGVDNLAKLSGKSAWQRLLPLIEKNIALVVSSGVIAVVIIWLTITEGIPGLAKLVAFNLPVEVQRSFGDGVLQIIDDHFADPSELPASIQDKLQRRFAPYLGQHGSVGATLVFRKSSFGANAFALSPGTILFTDDLVNLAENDDQLSAVLFHELGHLKYRHILRRSLQGSFITVLTVLVTGDVSGINELIAGIPLLLIDTAYSREFEREADDFAVRQMISEDIPLVAFENILRRLEESHKVKDDQRTPGHESGNAITDYLSSHPGTPERLDLIRAFRSADNKENRQR